MSFRTKLLLAVLLTIFASVSVVAYAVTYYTQAAFEAMDAERTEALVAQFKKEFVQRGEEIARQAKNIAEANLTERMAIDLSHPNADLSIYFRDANGAAQDHGLDFVEFVKHDGVLVSSAQFPSRVGYKNEWITSVKDWNEAPAFLRKEELPDGVALSLTVVRTNNTVADKSLYITAGHRLDKNFLASLVLPAGMRALIYTNLNPTFTATSLLAEKIDAAFGSHDAFKKQFVDTAVKQFGSGWAWLVLADGKLQVLSTANQDSPYMTGQTPLLGVDVWEHAYYLKYQNKRADYVDAWWSVVNWNGVTERYSKAKAGK